MTPVRISTLGASFVIAAAMAASCTPTSPGTARSPAPPPPAASSSPAPLVLATAPVSPPRPPPPVVTTPMAGEPAANTLAEARLVATSCDNYEKAAKEIAKMRIAKMRAEVDASFRQWQVSQPGCWEEYRLQAEEERRAREGGLSEAYGRGSMGIGGGYGSVGTVGHGSGAGVMASRPPQVRMGATSVSGRAAPPGAKSSSASPRKADSASSTNNQVAGVDEADFVKTDGTYVYVASNGALRIVEAMNPRIVSVTRLPGSVREMFVEGNRAVVYTASGAGGKRCTYGYDCVFAGDGTATRILVYDISNRAEPKLARQIDLSGSLMAARRIGRAVHTVVADADSPTAAYSTWPAGLQTCGTREAIVRAKFAQLKAENERKIVANTWFPTIREKGVEKSMCGGLMRTAFSDGQAFTTVVSFDLGDDATPATTATLQSRPGAVFASGNALYLSVVHNKSGAGQRWYSFYPSVNEASEIHKFRIGEKPSDTRYAGSGVVPGHVLNQFSMDEWYGYLRIATTRGRVPDPRVESVVSILAEGEGGNLVRVGAIDHIAPGEDIRAVRFDDDRGYVVTFKKTDPLFVMDLYDPARPRILGELKIPGYSTYIHRIDPDHLLSIGFDADDKGSFAYFDGVILQLFDVRNPTEPKLIHKEKIGTRGSSSEAATNHLAFNYLGDRGLLAFPMTICEGGGDGRNGNELTFSGLLVYNVSVAEGFKRLGGIDHGTKGANCNTWWSNANSIVKRSIFLDELVYSIAADRAKVQRMGSLGRDVADLPLTQ